MGQSPMVHEDFDLLVVPDGDGYRVHVVSSPGGATVAGQPLVLPGTFPQIEAFLRRISAARAGRGSGAASQISRDIVEFGTALYTSLFNGDVEGCLNRSLGAVGENVLRLRLNFTACPELSDLPWEYLYDPLRRRFLCLSRRISVVRYLQLPDPVRPLPVAGPLRILAVIAAPDSDADRLDVEAEWANLGQALAGPIHDGRITLERLESATLPMLRRRLEASNWHILHFVGHGRFRTDDGVGELLLADGSGGGQAITGADLGVILQGHRSLRLVVLNACEGARTGSADPFAGIAQTLVLQGVPAVVAMQFEISDTAAIAFGQGFYEAVAALHPLDSAVALGRSAVYALPNRTEWATPVLYTQTTDTSVFVTENGLGAGMVSGTPESAASIDPGDECPLCGTETHLDGRRLGAALEFAYVFTRLDQLESGAWGTSVASWMREVGRERPDFELHSAIGVEGGIETTAICLQGLAKAWSGAHFADARWAARSRDYFRVRQSADGSVGYRRIAFRDSTPLIESTCRHTAQAALALAEMGRASTGLVDALRYVTARLQPDGEWNAAEIVRTAGREDRYPAMVIAATLHVARVCDANAAHAPRAGWPVPVPSEKDIELLAALARIDADRYPFFKPYASLETMLWYSFLTIVDLVADRDLVFLGDRVADGIERILDAVDEDGGLPFHAGGGHQDFGMVALLVAVLYSDAVLDLMAGEALARMKDMRYRSLGWLLEKFDRYPQEPELFDFLVSGTMSRLLVLPRCLRAEWSLARLAELDRVVEATRISVLQGAAPGVTRGILTAAFHAFQNDGVDTEALVDLLEQKAIGVVGDGN